MTKAACKVKFDTSDVPRDLFLTAGKAWRRCRAGQGDPDKFGHEDTKGLWFMKVNVVRDSYALNNQETSAWDTWREASPELRTVPANELPKLDKARPKPGRRYRWADAALVERRCLNLWFCAGGQIISK